MSYANTVKDEVAKQIDETSGTIELIATMKANANIIRSSEGLFIEIELYSAEYIRKLFKIIKNNFPYANIELKQKRVKLFGNSKSKYVLEIDHGLEILKSLKLINNGYLFGLNKLDKEILKDAEDKYKYIRGFFLSAGTINDPSKMAQYHLEFVSRNEDYLKELQKILKSVRINGKITKRQKQYCLYINKSEEIADFLIAIGATASLFEFEDYRILRDMHKVQNRINNIDIANEMKKMKKSEEQINAINKIKKAGEIADISTKTREIMRLREQYPESSMKELSEATEGRISKTNIAHHLKKVVEIASEIN